ncbi:McrB family protein [Phascolarctobacterium succinatutens]
MNDNPESIKRQLINALESKAIKFGFEDSSRYDDLKKKSGAADYIWSVICDLSLDCNTLMIKNFIGYYGDKNDGQGVQETLQLLRDKVDDLGEKNQQLDIKNKEQSKEIDELLNIRDEQRKQLKENEEVIAKQVKEIEELRASQAALKEQVENLFSQNSYLRNRKSYTSEVINYENEKQVFSVLRNNAIACGLNFNSDDLINFYTSVKSARLTIIEGISGTGKSKLVDLYGRTLGLDDNGHMLIVPVSPGWTDDTDILGYLDNSLMQYKESSIGLVSFLVEASKHPDKPFLVCFDEMNLAKVEYYFAQFISILENDVNNRILRIYNPKEEINVTNADEYPAEIRLGENIIFCGTINVDESTYRLSDKVLDRANLIKLQDSDFSVYDDERPVFIVVDVTLVDKPKPQGLTDDELSLLDELNEKLKNVNPRFCFAHRVVNQISRYLDAIPENDIDYTREKALDKLIVQKILPKVRGTEEQVRDLIGYIEDDNYVSGVIDKYLNDGKVEYPVTRKALKEKAKELRNYGYIG